MGIKKTNMNYTYTKDSIYNHIEMIMKHIYEDDIDIKRYYISPVAKDGMVKMELDFCIRKGLFIEGL